MRRRGYEIFGPKALIGNRLIGPAKALLNADEIVRYGDDFLTVCIADCSTTCTPPSAAHLDDGEGQDHPGAGNQKADAHGARHESSGCTGDTS